MDARDKLIQIIPQKVSYDDDAVIILEDSNGLEGPIKSFRDFLIDMKIRHNVYYRLSEMPRDILVEIIKNGLDVVIAFMSTGVRKTPLECRDILVKLAESGFIFKVIEVVLNTPVFARIPKINNERGSIKGWNLYCHGSYPDDLEHWDITEKNKDER